MHQGPDPIDATRPGPGTGTPDQDPGIFASVERLVDTGKALLSAETDRLKAKAAYGAEQCVQIAILAVAALFIAIGIVVTLFVGIMLVLAPILGILLAWLAALGIGMALLAVTAILVRVRIKRLKAMP